MNNNERLIEGLKRAIEIHPDVELGKLIRYVSSIDDLAYMSDEDLAIQVEHYNKSAERNSSDIFYNYQPEPTGIALIDAWKMWENPLYDFTKENEQIAYDRYKAYMEGRVFFDLVEKVNMKDFLERFELEFVDAEDYADTTVINHKDNFLNIFPMTYRHMNGYVVARKGDKYIAKHVYLVKNPCFGELIDYAMQKCNGEYDECLVIALDWMGSPRFTDYTRHILFGLEYREKEQVVEIFNDNQTIEKFHEFFQRANKIISDWDGVLYDDNCSDIR